MKTFDEMLRDSLEEDCGPGEICDYIRSGIGVEEKRRALLEVERMIKDIAGNEKNLYLFDLFSQKETDDIESLVLMRSFILDEMMPHTPKEMERFKYQNDRLLRLTQEATKQERNMIQMFFHSPYREKDLMLYDIEKSLTFTWGGG